MSQDLTHTAIVFPRDGLGYADTALRHRLAVNYLRTLTELDQCPQAILFYAEGVRLVAEGSPCLPELQALSAAGVPLVACRTCLESLGLLDRVRVGEIGTMLAIVEAQIRAEKVMTV